MWVTYRLSCHTVVKTHDLHHVHFVIVLQGILRKFMSNVSKAVPVSIVIYDNFHVLHAIKLYATKIIIKHVHSVGIPFIHTSVTFVISPYHKKMQYMNINTIITNHVSPGVYNVPKMIDQEVSRLKLAAKNIVEASLADRVIRCRYDSPMNIRAQDICTDVLQCSNSFCVWMAVCIPDTCSCSASPVNKKSISP